MTHVTLNTTDRQGKANLTSRCCRFLVVLSTAVVTNTINQSINTNTRLSIIVARNMTLIKATSYTTLLSNFVLSITAETTTYPERQSTSRLLITACACVTDNTRQTQTDSSPRSITDIDTEFD